MNITFLQNELREAKEALNDGVTDAKAKLADGTYTPDAYASVTHRLDANVRELQDRLQQAIAVSTATPAPSGNYRSFPKSCPFLYHVLLQSSSFYIIPTSNY